MLFKIPLNQRKYSWKKEQREQYWKDVKKTLDSKEETHYLGVISLIETEGDFNVKEYEVIDGQQRLITTLLLVSALRDFYIALGDQEKAEELQKKFMSAKKTRKIYDKLTSCRLDKYTFNNIVNINKNVGEINPSEKAINLKTNDSIKKKKNGYRKVEEKENEYINDKMLEAYEYFYKNIYEGYNAIENEDEKYDFLIKLEECFAKIEIILIISYNREDLFLFFDSLNNRGLQLNQIDIIRNNLLEIVANKFSGNPVKEFSICWDDLVVKLDNLNGIKFLKYYYICAQEKIIPNKNLPSRYKEYFKSFDRNELKNEIEKIIEYADIYEYLFTESGAVSSEDKKYVKNIKRINKIGQQACHAFLMDYFYNVKCEERRNKITDYIEKMMYRRKIYHDSARGLKGIFRGIIQTKQDGKYIDEEIIKQIKKDTPSNNKFKDSFRNRSWDDGKITEYTLRKYEYFLLKTYYQGDDGAYIPILKRRDKVTLEHIMPKNYTKEWKEKLDLSEEEYNRYKYKIGNLILLEKEYNSSAKDKLFNDKLIAYKRSTIKQVKTLINEYKTWDIKSIEKRSNELAKIASKIWAID